MKGCPGSILDSNRGITTGQDRKGRRIGEDDGEHPPAEGVPFCLSLRYGRDLCSGRGVLLGLWRHRGVAPSANDLSANDLRTDFSGVSSVNTFGCNAPNSASNTNLPTRRAKGQRTPERRTSAERSATGPIPEQRSAAARVTVRSLRPADHHRPAENLWSTYDYRRPRHGHGLRAHPGGAVAAVDAYGTCPGCRGDF